MKYYDVIIIGGGAAGMMAAISCKRSHPDYSVAILDRTFALGRKILVCGAGRCNITNVNLDKSIEDHYYGSTPEFIRSIFSQFGYQDILKFFNNLGVELYVERKTDIGKLFPVTDQAATITEMMLDEISRLGIEVILNTEVDKLKITTHPTPPLREETGRWNFEIQTNDLKTQEQKEYNSKYVILSAGGKTYPALGSNGTGYGLAESLGHSIITPVPSALPLESKNQLSQLLQGQKMEIEVTSIIEGKEIKTRKDDVMFTKYGLSGPAILNISREISIHFNRENKNNCFVRLNFFPGKTQEEVRTLLEERWNLRPDQLLEKSLYGLFPNKICKVLIQFMNLKPETPVKNLSSADRAEIAETLSNTKLRINATRSWNEAEFTAGGVDTKDINEKTLESKIVPNLFFCGEILDVDGDVGGFNLSWSWASGNVAGKLIMN